MVATRRSDPHAPNDPEVEAAFLASPDEIVAEILDGELSLQPRPGRPHTNAASALGALIGGPFRFGTGGGPGGWVILDEPEIHLGPKPDKIVPDLAGWRRSRMPDAVGPEGAPYYYELAPDWVCEVISKSTETVDRGKKMRIYRREGVGHLWLVSPNAQLLEVYRLESAHWLLLETYHGDSLIRAEPFEAVEIPLGALWQP